MKVRMVEIIVKSLLVTALAFTNLTAQAITVRLLNAKSGKPIKKLNVTFEWNDGSKSSEYNMGKSGSTLVDIPGKSEAFVMIPGPRAGKDEMRIPYVDCNNRSSEFISVTEVRTHGVAPLNQCGSPHIKLLPGQVVFWALPLPWWKPDFQ